MATATESEEGTRADEMHLHAEQQPDSQTHTSLPYQDDPSTTQHSSASLPSTMSTHHICRPTLAFPTGVYNTPTATAALRRLEIRQMIIFTLTLRIQPIYPPSNPLHYQLFRNQACCGNGDVKRDVLLAFRRFTCCARPDTIWPVWEVYGIMDLMSGDDDVNNWVNYAPRSAEFHDRVFRTLLAQPLPWDPHSYTQLLDEVESLRTGAYERRMYGPLGTLLENDDMLVILNARGTVVLNPAFAYTEERIEIAKLAWLALSIWHNRIELPLAGAVVIFQELLKLVRDDVETLLFSAIAGFSASVHDSQLSHINVFAQRVWVCRRALSQLLSVTNFQFTVAERRSYETRMELARRSCELHLQKDIGNRAELRMRNQHMLLGTEPFDHGSEYVGDMLSSEYPPDLQTAQLPLAYPWLQKRRNGKWFDAQHAPPMMVNGNGVSVNGVNGHGVVQTSFNSEPTLSTPPNFHSQPTFNNQPAFIPQPAIDAQPAFSSLPAFDASSSSTHHLPPYQGSWTTAPAVQPPEVITPNLSNGDTTTPEPSLSSGPETPSRNVIPHDGLSSSSSNRNSFHSSSANNIDSPDTRGSAYGDGSPFAEAGRQGNGGPYYVGPAGAGVVENGAAGRDGDGAS